MTGHKSIPNNWSSGRYRRISRGYKLVDQEVYLYHQHNLPVTDMMKVNIALSIRNALKKSTGAAYGICLTQVWWIFKLSQLMM
ncbi:MAG: hypothetical protein N4A71_26655 [Carboxylicivirga sp.]|jgi:hypothetical protein|nr:hypothetical protein [Carboxylicivirga sp.]